MWKAKKEHRKKVDKRNEKIATEKKKFQKQYTQLLEQKLKEYQEKLTQNEQLENDLKVSIGGQELGFSIVDPSELENRESDVNWNYESEWFKRNQINSHWKTWKERKVDDGATWS